MTDPVKQSDLLDQRILAIPADKVFTKRTIVVAFLILWGTSVIGFGVASEHDRRVIESVRDLSRDTNERVAVGEQLLRDALARNDAEITELEQQVDGLSSALTQTVDHILVLNEMLTDAGITPPEFTVRTDIPPTTED